MSGDGDEKLMVKRAKWKLTAVSDDRLSHWPPKGRHQDSWCQRRHHPSAFPLPRRLLSASGVGLASSEDDDVFVQEMHFLFKAGRL